MNSFVINNVRVVTPYEVLENGFIYIRNGVIDAIEMTSQQKLHRSCNVIDGHGKWLFPGIVDIFSTALEKSVESIDDLPFPLETNFEAFENKLVSNGITTVCHALVSGAGNTVLLSSEDTVNGETRFTRLKKNGSIRHNVNLLYNINDTASFPLLMNMIDRKELQIISVTLNDCSKVNEQDISQQKNDFQKIASFIDLLAEKARKHDIRIASFCEESNSRISYMKKLGIKILEFPPAFGAIDAEYSDMTVLLGAPGVVRTAVEKDKSRIVEALLNNSVNMLCSENSPASIINTMFLLYHTYKMDMAEAFRKVSINPASALGIGRRTGSIECGKLADLTLVRENDGKPFVEKVFINGFKVFEKIAPIDKITKHLRIVQW